MLLGGNMAVAVPVARTESMCSRSLFFFFFYIRDDLTQPGVTREKTYTEKEWLMGHHQETEFDTRRSTADARPWNCCIVYVADSTAPR